MSSITTSLDSHKLKYERTKVPKNVSNRAYKQADKAILEKFGDFGLITGTIRIIYIRHAKGIWTTVALLELAYIIWRIF